MINDVALFALVVCKLQMDHQCMALHKWLISTTGLTQAYLVAAWATQSMDLTFQPTCHRDKPRYPNSKMLNPIPSG